MREFIGRSDVELTIDVPYTRGDLISRIHEEGEVLTSEHTADGTTMRVRVPAAFAGILEPLRA